MLSLLSKSMPKSQGKSKTAMLRDAAGLAKEVSTATTKIRKRCAVSLSPSAASSSDRHRQRRRWELRAKRSVRLIGRSVRAASPFPIIISSSSRVKRRRMSEPSWTNRRCRHGDVETRSSASARKLVSALWQHGKGVGAGAFEEEDEVGEGAVGWDDVSPKRRSSADHRRSASVEVLSKLSRRKIKAFKDDGERSWHNGHAHGHCFSDVMSNGGTVGGRTPARQGDGNRTTVQMKELYNSLTASNELVRVLANVLGPTGGLNATAASVLAALRSELDAARQLVKQHRRGGEEHDYERRLRRQLAEEVRAWKCRHREKAAAAARLVASELDGERRSRRRAERVGKKLAEALADAEASLRVATRELELERASREHLEKVCDELARGVAGGTEAEEEELRREAAATALEELEREREMLQVADELREERVRMKLAEARLHFEEKNAVVDRLRQELEAFLFLCTTQERPEKTPVQHHELVAKDQQLQLVLASEFGVDGIDRVVVTEKSGQEENAQADDADDDSEGSDIELNMDGNSWSYTNTSRSRETTTAKNAASVHGSLSDRATESEATRDALELQLQEQDWAADGCSDDGTTTKDMEEDAERYEAIKNLREQMLAGHAFLFLSKGEADADSDRHRHGFASHFEDGGLW